MVRAHPCGNFQSGFKASHLLQPSPNRFFRVYLSFWLFFCRTVFCKLLCSSRFAGCSYLMFFRLVVVPHMDSRTWMIYSRLSIHKMFGTNPVVFAWLPVFPCFRVFSIDGFNPLLSLFRVSFQCWKRIKLKKVRTCTVLTCTMAIMRSAKPLPPFLQLMPTTAQILISLRKNPSGPAIFFLKTR